MAQTKQPFKKRAMMGMPLMTPSHSGKGITKKMGKKDGKGKTSCIGIEQLEKIRPCITANPTQGR